MVLQGFSAVLGAIAMRVCIASQVVVYVCTACCVLLLPLCASGAVELLCTFGCVLNAFMNADLR